MSLLVPNRFLFHFEFPLRFRAKPPVIDGRVGDWSDEYLLPRLGSIDGRAEFGDVWACWNDEALFIACRVEKKRRPLSCDPKSFWTGDNLRLCVSSRETRKIRRATRFCTQIYFLPTGGGDDRRSPVAGVNKFQRAKEDAPVVSAKAIEIASSVSPTGYAMEARIPHDCLFGFDPGSYPRIGLYYLLEDGDHGQQYLTVGDDLNWHIDPSTWATAVLAR